MTDQELKSKIFYYLREKCYHTMQVAALEGIMKYPVDTSFKLFNSMAMALCGRLQESIRDLESLQSDEEFLLASLAGLIYIHKKNQTAEKQVYQNLDIRLKEVRKKAGPNELYYTAVFLFGCSKYEKARDYIEKSLKLNSNHIESLVLKGWTEIYNARNGISEYKDVSKCFSIAQNENKRNLDAYFGEIECLEFEKQLETALNIVNKVIVKFPSMIEPVVRKMKICFSLQEWDLTIETMNRVISMDSTNIEGAKMKILLLLCKDGNNLEAVDYLRSFHKLLEKAEPRNADLFYTNAQLFSRICGRNKPVLQETFLYVQKAVQLDQNNADFITEAGYQCLLQGKIKDALRYYKSASKLQNTSLSALIGMMLCELSENGITEQIHHQMEFLLEMQGSNVSAMLLFIRAKLACEKPENAIKYLNEAVDKHMKPLQWHGFTDAYLRLLDPDFLLDITKEYLRYAPKQTDVIGENKTLQQSNSVVKKSLHILKTLTNACPGLLEGLYLVARVGFLTGDTASAMSTLQHILKDVDTTSAEAHLLMAQIYVQQGFHHRAAQSLEMGLSYNFKVRENPLYHYITGLIHKNDNNIDETIKSLTTALSLIDFQPKDTSYIKSGEEFTNELTLADKASLYMELVKAYAASGQSHEAAKILHDALEEFMGSPEEARFMILNAEQALEKRDIKTAIEVLSKIKPEEPYYMQAHTKLAHIYLKYRHDCSAFMQCFREVVEHCPGPESYLLFGDACMSIQEPDRAIDAYERALNYNPRDPVLASKMGLALIKTHNYNRAINYYRDAIKLTESSELKIDLTNLHILLKQYDRAEAVIREELESNKKNGDDDFTSLQSRTKSLLLLANIQEKSGNINSALGILKEAKECQNRIQKRVPLEQPGSAEDQLKISVKICVRMAELFVSMRDSEKATHMYKEALSLYPTDSDILLSLAKLYMQMNYLELCQQTCSTLLKTDPDNEAASVMMADLAFRKVDFDSASYHFKQLLNKQPTYWTALARLVEVMRRTGGLEEVPQYLKNAEETSIRPTKEPGLAYCNGLYEWYSGNPNAALRHFNNARQDAEWGQQAIYNMIEICLNPEDEMLGGDAFDTIEDMEYRDSRSMALRTAERLLKELKPRPGGIDDEALRHRLLGNFLLLATKQKTNIERALDDFVNVASQETFKDHIGPILGVASSYILLKQTQRARNQLKRVAKSIWTFEDAEYLERCWLLLADLYIQSAKYDLASDLLRRVLQHNKTCTKAYEFLGFIAEKEQHYKEATNYYDNAWKYGGKNNPAVGYKLAFNYMKCKKFADAIDISNQVLKLHPDYPKIKKDILDKSLNNLRS